MHISPIAAASILPELLPEEVPLPASLHSPSTRTPSIVSRLPPPSPFMHISPPAAVALVLSELLPPLPASVGSPSIMSELLPEEIDRKSVV